MLYFHYLQRVFLPQLATLLVSGLAVLVVAWPDMTKAIAWLLGVCVASLAQLYAGFYSFRLALTGDANRDQQVLAKITRGHFGKIAIVASGTALVLTFSEAIRQDSTAALMFFLAIILSLVLQIALSSSLSTRPEGDELSN